MYKVLVVSHSTLCKGFKEAAQMILGVKASIDCLSLDEEGIDIFHEKLKEKIKILKDKNNEVLILADLYGGSPFNRSLIEVSKDKDIRLIAGVNLSMIIEAIINETSKLDEVISKIVESSKDSIKEGLILKNNNLDDE